MHRCSGLVEQRENQHSAMKLRDGHFCILESRSCEDNIIFTVSANGAIIGSDSSSLTLPSPGDCDMVPMKLDNPALKDCNVIIVFKNHSFYLSCVNNADILLKKNASAKNSTSSAAEKTDRILSNDPDCDASIDAESNKNAYSTVTRDGVALDDGDMIIMGSIEFRVSVFRRESSHDWDFFDSKSAPVSCCCEPNFRWRNSMEDRIHVEENCLGDQTTFVGVYDGHAGGVVADFACTVLHQNLRRALEFGIDCVSAFDKAYEWTNRGIFGLGDAGKYSGCTAATLVLMPQHQTKAKSRLVVANVGDSQAILSRQGQAFQLSSVHTCANQAEVERIRICGGHIINKRLMGLTVTRALGDISLSSYGLSAKPFICDVQLESNEAEFVIVATDGVRMLQQVHPALI